MLAVLYILNHAVRHRINPVDPVSSIILHSDLVHSQKIRRAGKRRADFFISIVTGAADGALQSAVVGSYITLLPRLLKLI